MILQPQGGNYLTEAADVNIEQRHFATIVMLNSPADAAKWREVTEAEKEKLLNAGTIFDPSRLCPAYLDKVNTLLTEIPKAMNTVTTFSKADALKFMDYYPEWGDENAPMGKEVSEGFRLRHGGKLWEVRQTHTLQAEWEPGAEGTEALYEEVCQDHAGTIDDPIPYDNNMELEEGKYYSQDGATYLCTRGTGQAVYNPLSELVGLYVEVASESKNE